MGYDFVFHFNILTVHNGMICIRATDLDAAKQIWKSFDIPGAKISHIDLPRSL